MYLLRARFCSRKTKIILFFYVLVFKDQVIYFYLFETNLLVFYKKLATIYFL
jgi:hypothetical protein